MNMKQPVTIILTAMAFALNACAQSKPVAGIKSGIGYVSQVESVTQKLPEGEGDGYTDIQRRFVIVWKGKQPPETFYWRGTDGWLDCAVAKVTKKKTKALPNYKKGENWYTKKDISLEKIKKGDTLELIVVHGGRNTIPEEIPATTTNKIFFKTATTGWLYFPVTKTIKRPDIVK